jgi:hypothetical protein
MVEIDVQDMKKYGESYYILVSKDIRKRLDVQTDARLKITFEKME